MTMLLQVFKDCYNVFQVKVVSPKHRLIKVDSQEFSRSKIPLSPVTIHQEPVWQFLLLISLFHVLCIHMILLIMALTL